MASVFRLTIHTRRLSCNIKEGSLLCFSSFDGCRHKTRNVTVLVKAGNVATNLDLSNAKHLHSTQPFFEHRLQLAKPFRLCHYLWSRHVSAVMPGEVVVSREKVIEFPFLYQ